MPQKQPPAKIARSSLMIGPPLDDAIPTERRGAGDCTMVYIGTWHSRRGARTMPRMSALLNDHEITERVLAHIANRSTDAGDVLWREPVENYRSKPRFEAETERVLRRSFTAFCPSA